MLKNLIEQKKARVAIVGLGYVGLPTAITIARCGFFVVGVDINKERVKQLNEGHSFIREIPDQTIKEILPHFRATTDWQEIRQCQIVLITVPTPLTKNKTPDTSFIKNAAKNIAEYLQPNSLVVLESTSYPGTTEELLKPLLPPCYLAFAPERIDPGNKKHQFENIPKVVGGINWQSTDLAATFYEQFLKAVHKVSSPKTAEMTKLLENIYRLVNISLVNELKMVSDKMGIDFWEVIEAAKTKPYGFTPFYPGPGCGGHCIPLDPFYLSWRAREINFFTRFIDLAGEINELMPHYAVTRINWLLNHHQKSINNSQILVLGVAYKKDIDDARESPALAIIKDLTHKKAQVIYNDPHVPEIKIGEQTMYSTPISAEILHQQDCVVISTDHSTYDYPMIVKEAKVIIDLRNAIKFKDEKVVK